MISNLINRKIFTLLKVQYSNMLEYRVEIALWAISGIIPFFMLNIWTNNNLKTSFRYFKWTVQEVSIGKLINISFFSGLFISTLLNTTITSTSFRKNTLENVEDDFGSQYNEEDLEPNVEMPPQRDIRETQPTISVNYRVVKNINDNNFKKDRDFQI